MDSLLQSNLRTPFLPRVKQYTPLLGTLHRIRRAFRAAERSSACMPADVQSSSRTPGRRRIVCAPFRKSCTRLANRRCREPGRRWRHHRIRGRNKRAPDGYTFSSVPRRSHPRAALEACYLRCAFRSRPEITRPEQCFSIQGSCKEPAGFGGVQENRWQYAFSSGARQFGPPPSILEGRGIDCCMPDEGAAPACRVVVGPGAGICCTLPHTCRYLVVESFVLWPSRVARTRVARVHGSESGYPGFEPLPGTATCAQGPLPAIINRSRGD